MPPYEEAIARTGLLYDHAVSMEEMEAASTAPTTPQGKKRRRSAEASSQATPPTVEETEEAIAPYEEEGCSPIRNPLS